MEFTSSSTEYRALQTAYGGIALDSVAGFTITLTTTDSFYTLPKFNITSQPSKNVSYGDSTLTIGLDGVYRVGLSGSIGITIANEIIHTQIFVNDVMLSGSEFEVKLGTSGDVGTGSTTTIARLSAGDVLKIKYSRESGSGDVVAKHANITVNRID